MTGSGNNNRNEKVWSTDHEPQSIRNPRSSSEERQSLDCSDDVLFAVELAEVKLDASCATVDQRTEPRLVRRHVELFHN